MVKLILILKYYDLERILNLKENSDPLICKSIEREFVLFLKHLMGILISVFVLSNLISFSAKKI